MSGDPYHLWPSGIVPPHHSLSPLFGHDHSHANPAPDFPFTDHHLRGLIREIVREELRAAGVIKDCS